MHVNALRLLKLINNLLDLAKIEDHQLEVRRQPISLTDVAADLVSGAQPLAAKKRLTLTLRADPHVPVINADPDALEKIIMNLVGNALKFTEPDGSIDVEVTANEGGAAVCVRDTGIGLEHNQLDRIFDRFAQVDNSATRRHEGTGIGLSPKGPPSASGYPLDRSMRLGGCSPRERTAARSVRGTVPRLLPKQPEERIYDIASLKEPSTARSKVPDERRSQSGRGKPHRRSSSARTMQTCADYCEIS
jgi:hypothetical protein